MRTLSPEQLVGLGRLIEVLNEVDSSMYSLDDRILYGYITVQGLGKIEREAGASHWELTTK